MCQWEQNSYKRQNAIYEKYRIKGRESLFRNITKHQNRIKKHGNMKKIWNNLTRNDMVQILKIIKSM